MSQIPDYTEEELTIVQNTIANRWKKETVKTQIADVEIQIVPKNRS